MTEKIKLPLISDLFGALDYIVVAIITLILIVIGIVVLWATGLLTGVIMALVLLLIGWALLKTKTIPTDKYPWAPLLIWIFPVIGFFIGVISEKKHIFWVTPLLKKTEPITPFYAGQELQWIQTNPEAILILIVLICLLAVLLKSGKTE
jgi:hypothetical protein